MKELLGMCVLLAAWVFFIWLSIRGGMRDIWPFGVILFAATVAILIRNYYLSKK